MYNVQTICNQLCQTQIKLERPGRGKVYEDLKMDGEEIEETKDKRCDSEHRYV